MILWGVLWSKKRKLHGGNMAEGKNVEDEIRLFRTRPEKRMEKGVKYMRRKMQELLTV